MEEDSITDLYWEGGGTHALPTLLSYCLFQFSTFSRICFAGTYRKKRGRREEEKKRRREEKKREEENKSVGINTFSVKKKKRRVSV